MKTLITFFLSLLLAGVVTGKHVTSELARLVAINQYRHYLESGYTDLSITHSFEAEYNGLVTYYAFNFNAGGFVLVAADDAVTPILGYSYEGYYEKDVSNPAVKAWFDAYSMEIYRIVQASLDNTSTLHEWNDILESRFKKPGKDVGPLISSTWDQDTWYNFFCPADEHGPGNKAYAGCAATAAGMIMKYHGFPAKGIGSHSYQSYKYGTLTADFQAASYNWAGMDTTANSGNYEAIASLLYHLGVAFDMNYGPDKSGAYTENVAKSLVNYFNYEQSTLKYILKENYPGATWEQMLRDELDNSRPVYYGGCDYESCHAFICDGYRSADNRFHFNWGWSGMYNGYYVIGGLNPLGSWFNLANEAIIGIQPGNPELIVRISNPLHNKVVSPGTLVEINASVCIGSSNKLNLYINDQLITKFDASSFTYKWNTAGLSLGEYLIKVEAVTASDTAFHSVSIGLGDWITQNSGFNAPARGIQYIHAVDSSVVWATSTDGINPKNYIQEFTKTVNGGDYWSSGIINNCAGLVPSMIFALNADTAYCPMYRVNGSNKQGIYVTRDGGKTWSHQSTAYFEFPGAFPNAVHFFNKNDGWYMGDPIFNTFVCAITYDGGNKWTDCPEPRYITALSGEKATTGYYSAVGDHIWFGTTKGRVCRSADKGCTWDVSTTTLASETPWVDVVIDVAFADEYHGLAQDRSRFTKGDLSETFDGGITWDSVVTSGPVFYGDLAYVPGTGNTWVTCGFSENASGASYSYDGGHTWQLFKGLEEVQFLSMDWVNNKCGWLGSFSNMSNKKGVIKYGGLLPISDLAAPDNLKGILTGRNVHLTWEKPEGAYLPVGYNIFRNHQLITPTPVTTLSYYDLGLVNADYSYCVSAVYAGGESTQICVRMDITVELDECCKNEVKIFPNPVSSGLLNISSGGYFNSVCIRNSIGQLVYKNNYRCHNLQVITTSFKPGLYFVEVLNTNGITTQKLIIP